MLAFRILSLVTLIIGTNLYPSAGLPAVRALTAAHKKQVKQVRFADDVKKDAEIKPYNPFADCGEIVPRIFVRTDTDIPTPLERLFTERYSKTTTKEWVQAITPLLPFPVKFTLMQCFDRTFCSKNLSYAVFFNENETECIVEYLGKNNNQRPTYTSYTLDIANAQWIELRPGLIHHKKAIWPRQIPASYYAFEGNLLSRITKSRDGKRIAWVAESEEHISLYVSDVTDDYPKLIERKLSIEKHAWIHLISEQSQKLSRSKKLLLKDCAHNVRQHEVTTAQLARVLSRFPKYIISKLIAGYNISLQRKEQNMSTLSENFRVSPQ